MFYTILTLMAFFFFLGKMGIERLLLGKYKKNFLYRLGLKKQYLPDFQKSVIWVHAVSLGEVKAVTPLVHSLHEKYPDCVFIISTLTETGHDEAKKALSFAEAHLFLPMDLPWLTGSLVKKAKPCLVILSETDFWYGFLKKAKALGAKICLVNGKMSDKSFFIWSKIKGPRKKLFGLVDHFFVQNQEYKDRFVLLDVPDEKITLTGNLKWDGLKDVLPNKEKVEHALGLKTGDVLIVMGSTHAGEEKKLITSLLPLLQKNKFIKIAIIPRHPERFLEVYALLQFFSLPVARYSEKAKNNEQLLLVDAMGVLKECYALSTLSVVGGSFERNIGGHNILEPLIFEKAPLFGPYMHKQKELKASILQAEAGLEVNYNSFARVVEECLEDLPDYILRGKKGKILIEQSVGAVKKTLKSSFFEIALADK